MDRDATVLRKQVMAGTGDGWETKVQLSVGRLALGTIRTGLTFVRAPDLADAKLALKAVKAASVGVYQRKTSDLASWSRERLLNQTDQAMGQRGWTRLVGVMDKREAVLVYVPVRHGTNGPINLCVAVLNQGELVVVSATVDAAGLSDLMEKHLGDDLKRNLKLAQF